MGQFLFTRSDFMSSTIGYKACDIKQNDENG